MSGHRKEFLSLDTIDIWGWIIVVGGCLVQCRMFTNTPGFYSLDESSAAPLRYNNKKQTTVAYQSKWCRYFFICFKILFLTMTFYFFEIKIYLLSVFWSIASPIFFLQLFCCCFNRSFVLQSFLFSNLWFSHKLVFRSRNLLKFRFL